MAMIQEIARISNAKKAYIIESNQFVSEVEILKSTKTYSIVRLPSGGGIRVSNTRIFKTKEEADASLKYSRK